MPGLPVAQLVDEFRARNGGARVLLCTGYAADEAHPLPATDGFLHKPFAINEFLNAADRLAADAVGANAQLSQSTWS